MTIHYSSCPICHSDKLVRAFDVKDHSISGQTFPLWKCQDCTFLFTQDVPVPEEAGQYYQSENYISHSDDSKGLVNKAYHLARDYMLSRKRKLVNRLATGKRLLDYGTGTGYFVDHMQRHGYQATGIEIDENARNYGRQKFGIEVHAPDYLATGFKPSSFDVITLWHVLEHLYDPYSYIDVFNNILTKEGVLIVAVPNHVAKDARHYESDWAAYDVPRHLWHFSPKTMRLFLDKAGFRIDELHHMPLDPFYVSIMSEKYTKGTLPMGVWTGLQSFLRGINSPEQASSVIYVCRKK